MAAFNLIFPISKFAIFFSILYKFTQISRYKLMGTLSFFISVCSLVGFCKRVFLGFLGILVMDCASNSSVLMNNLNDFGCGFLVFGGFSGVLGVLILVILGFKFLQFRGNFSELGIKKAVLSQSLKKVCLNDDHGEFNGVKNSSFDGIGNEDEVFDVMCLRKMVKLEKRKAKAAHKELEKERMAASSSVDETMAMILRLQNEKSALQIKVNQLERNAEEKKLHDQEVIQSLQWIIMKHESERDMLQEQLRLCREKLRVFIKDNEWDQFECVCPTPSALGNDWKLECLT